MRLSVPALLCLALAWSPSFASQNCPDHGVRSLSSQTQGASGGVNCGSGLTFEFDGVTYKASQDICPSGIYFTPERRVPEPTARRMGFQPVAGGTVYVTFQAYTCRACDWFGTGAFTCCTPVGGRRFSGVLQDYVVQPCVGGGQRSFK